RNTIIIMTSNVGANQISRDMHLGFTIKEDEDKAKARDYDRMREKVTGELKQTFRPEFLNRIDAVIVFHSLAKDQIRQIVDLELARVRKQLLEQDIELEVTEAAMDLLGERGYDHTYGARPLRRIIQNLIEDPLAEGVLDTRFQAGSTIRVDVEEDLLKLEPVNSEAGAELAGVS
ncbi:MAG: ATP-dependent Clp protease ATP-binding subunit, partial [Thermomicrobiales bacterium]|nr:ATP-dependent Clp protease ATP-binding subunit [Thermomicrobiales bacterium]